MRLAGSSPACRSTSAIADGVGRPRLVHVNPTARGSSSATRAFAGTIVFLVKKPPQLETEQRPSFNAFLYTLDLLLPIGSLGQLSGTVAASE